jgi:hypothetical protein
MFLHISVATDCALLLASLPRGVLLCKKFKSCDDNFVCDNKNFAWGGIFLNEPESDDRYCVASFPLEDAGNFLRAFEDRSFTSQAVNQLVYWAYQVVKSGRGLLLLEEAHIPQDIIEQYKAQADLLPIKYSLHSN